MSNEMSRVGWIGMWFVGVVVAIASGAVLGAVVSVDAVALMLLASVVPPAIILIVWRGGAPRAIAAFRP